MLAGHELTHEVTALIEWCLAEIVSPGHELLVPDK
jgi:hypothetical protein